MKKTTVLLALVLLFCTGCKTQNKVPSRQISDGKISVISTIFAPYDFTRAIAGDLAELTMLLPPASESHSYEPTPQDTVKIHNCDVFIYVGGESDAWVEKILSSADTEKIKIVTLIDCVEPVYEEITEGMEHGGEEHGEHSAGEEEYDEHVWTAPENAKLIVRRIADALCLADEKNAETYRLNTETYLDKLEELDAKFRSLTNNALRNTMIFADRFPFRYFADAYGLEYFAAFPGCSAETEPSAATVAFLIDKVKAEGISAVFYTELSNEKMADVICEATGAKKLLLHACHNISRSDFESGATYLSLMEKNAENLEIALS